MQELLNEFCLLLNVNQPVICENPNSCDTSLIKQTKYRIKQTTCIALLSASLLAGLHVASAQACRVDRLIKVCIRQSTNELLRSKTMKVLQFSRLNTLNKIVNL